MDKTGTGATSRRRTHRLVAGGAIGLATIVGIACGGSSSPELPLASPDTGAPVPAEAGPADAGSKPYTLDDVCERTAPLICELRKPCCERADAGGFDLAGCLSHTKNECAKDVAEARAGRQTFHPERIEQCIPKYKTIFDACVLSFDLLLEHARTIGGCEIFTGQGVEGTACERTSQCKPGANENEFAGCDEDTKKCKYTYFVGEGSPCSFTDGLPNLCDKGLYCDITRKNDAGELLGTCKTKTAAGAVCAGSLECGLGSYCTDPPRRCATAKGGNEACGDNLDCQSVSCVKPDAGDAGVGACAALESLSKPEECKGP